MGEEPAFESSLLDGRFVCTASSNASALEADGKEWNKWVGAFRETEPNVYKWEDSGDSLNGVYPQLGYDAKKPDQLNSADDSGIKATLTLDGDHVKAIEFNGATWTNKYGKPGCCSRRLNLCRKREKAPSLSKGPVSVDERKCTDVMCLLLFLVFCVGWVGVAAVSLVSGEPERLIYGTDYAGYTCGIAKDTYIGGNENIHIFYDNAITKGDVGSSYRAIGYDVNGKKVDAKITDMLALAQTTFGDMAVKEGDEKAETVEMIRKLTEMKVPKQFKTGIVDEGGHERRAIVNASGKACSPTKDSGEEGMHGCKTTDEAPKVLIYYPRLAADLAATGGDYSKMKPFGICVAHDAKTRHTDDPNFRGVPSKPDKPKLFTPVDAYVAQCPTEQLGDYADTEDPSLCPKCGDLVCTVEGDALRIFLQRHGCKQTGTTTKEEAIKAIRGETENLKDMGHVCDESGREDGGTFNAYEIAEFLIGEGVCFSVPMDTSNLFNRCLGLPAKQEESDCVEPQCDPERDGYGGTGRTEGATNPAILQCARHYDRSLLDNGQVRSDTVDCAGLNNKTACDSQVSEGYKQCYFVDGQGCKSKGDLVKAAVNQSSCTAADVPDAHKSCVASMCQTPYLRESESAGGAYLYVNADGNRVPIMTYKEGEDNQQSKTVKVTPTTKICDADGVVRGQRSCTNNKLTDWDETWFTNGYVSAKIEEGCDPSCNSEECAYSLGKCDGESVRLPPWERAATNMAFERLLDSKYGYGAGTATMKSMQTLSGSYKKAWRIFEDPTCIRHDSNTKVCTDIVQLGCKEDASEDWVVKQAHQVATFPFDDSKAGQAAQREFGTCTRDGKGSLVGGCDGNGRCRKSLENKQCRVKISNSKAEGAASEDPVSEKLQSGMARFGRWVSDVYKTRAIIFFVGIVFSLAMGFFFLAVMRFCGRCIVWVTIIFFIVMCLAMTLTMYARAGMLNVAVAGNAQATAAIAEQAQKGEGREMQYKTAAYVFTVITAVGFIAAIALRAKINIAIEMIKEASKAIGTMRQIVFFPVVTSAKTVVLFLWFVYIGVYMCSVTNFDDAIEQASEYHAKLGNGTAPIAASENKALRYMMMYHFFGLLWTNQIITGIGMATIAGAISHWYWDREGFEARKKQARESVCACTCERLWTFCCMFGCRSCGKASCCQSESQTTVGDQKEGDDDAEAAPGGKCSKIDSVCHCVRRALEKVCEFIAKRLSIKTSVVYDSYARAVFKHIGSICFGALVIAIVQFLRAVLAYVDQQTKEMQGKNIVAKVVMKVVACCMWCFEKCLKFISKNAFIMVAMYGHTFCKAAYTSFGLMYDNILLIGTTTVVTNILLFISELAITLFCGWFAFMAFAVVPWYTAGGAHEPTSVMLPTILTMLAAYYVSSGFMHVYSMSIDTILLCCCVDKKENGKTGYVKMSKKMFGRMALDKDGVEYKGPERQGSSKDLTNVRA